VITKRLAGNPTCAGLFHTGCTYSTKVRLTRTEINSLGHATELDMNFYKTFKLTERFGCSPAASSKHFSIITTSTSQLKKTRREFAWHSLIQTQKGGLTGFPAWQHVDLRRAAKHPVRTEAAVLVSGSELLSLGSLRAPIFYLPL